MKYYTTLKNGVYLDFKDLGKSNEMTWNEKRIDLD